MDRKLAYQFAMFVNPQMPPIVNGVAETDAATRASLLLLGRGRRVRL